MSLQAQRDTSFSALQLEVIALMQYNEGKKTKRPHNEDNTRHATN